MLDVELLILFVRPLLSPSMLLKSMRGGKKERLQLLGGGPHLSMRGAIAFRDEEVGATCIASAAKP